MKKLASHEPVHTPLMHCMVIDLKKGLLLFGESRPTCEQERHLGRGSGDSIPTKHIVMFPFFLFSFFHISSFPFFFFSSFLIFFSSSFPLFFFSPFLFPFYLKMSQTPPIMEGKWRPCLWVKREGGAGPLNHTLKKGSICSLIIF